MVVVAVIGVPFRRAGAGWAACPQPATVQPTFPAMPEGAFLGFAHRRIESGAELDLLAIGVLRGGATTTMHPAYCLIAQVSAVARPFTVRALQPACHAKSMTRSTGSRASSRIGTESNQP